MEAVHNHIDAGAEARLATLMELSALNSGSHNRPGLARTATVLRSLLDEVGATTELIDSDPMEVVTDRGDTEELELGQIVRGSRRVSGTPSFLLLAHYDTVFEEDHGFQTPARDGDVLHGPGVADDKGGIVVMLAALSALQAAGLDRFGWEIVCNADEELGSPGSRRFLREAATRHDAGLVFEPSLPDGGLAARRKGSGTFHIVVRGVAAHAGRDHALGRNAVMIATRIAGQLDALTAARDGLTVNVSQIAGGGPVNIVPDRAVVRCNARVSDAESQRLIETRVDELAAEHSGDSVAVEVHGSFGRPPKLVTPSIETMYHHARDEARSLGFDLGWHATGGVCDGNDLAAAGLPNLDNLGPHGGGLHSSDEWIRISSLAERAKLAAGLMVRLAEERTRQP